MADLIKNIQIARSARNIRTLLDSGADVNYRNGELFTPLHYCFSYTKAREEAGSRNTLLAKARKRGRRSSRMEERGLEVVRLLVSRGADLNAKNRHGRTPLMEVIENGCNYGLMDALLDAGCDTDIVDDRGNTVLHSYLINCEDADDMNFNTFATLLERQRSTGVNLTNNSGENLALSAVKYPLSYIRLLVLVGVDLHCCDADRNTVLHKFLLSDASGDVTANLEYVKFLLDNGCNVNATNVFGLSPLLVLMLNLELCDFDMVQLLLDKGADVRMKTVDGANVIHLLLSRPIDCSKLLEVLLVAGADPNTRQSLGFSPLMQVLHLPESVHSANYLEILLKYGVTIDLGNTVEKSCLRAFYRCSFPKPINTVFKYALLQNASYEHNHVSFLYLTKWHREIKQDVPMIMDEFDRLASFVLRRDMTMYDFLVAHDPRKLVRMYRLCVFDLDALCKTFPRYCPLIRAKVEMARRWSAILNATRTMTLSTRLEGGGEVTLNSYCLMHVMEHLSSYDLLKLSEAGVAGESRRELLFRRVLLSP